MLLSLFCESRFCETQERHFSSKLSTDDVSEGKKNPFWKKDEEKKEIQGLKIVADKINCSSESL